ncbi:putative glycosyl transferase [Burkholderiales bacterium JOSHI_001]|nr:putative glycosyl transferase [Burkholderiales bacterium JOSHI_001]
MKRVLIYSHDTFGLGNIRRMLEVARHLVQSSPDVAVLVITGSAMLHAFRIPDRIDYVKLPCLQRDVGGTYGSRSLPLSLEATVRLRANIIRSTIADYEPDLILVDKKPFGVEDELAGALEALPRAAKRPKMMLLLRDILDSAESTSRVWRKNGYYEAISQYYDQVLVVGCAEVFDLRSEYNFPPFAAAKVNFCGYIAREAGRMGRDEARRQIGVLPQQPLVLVTPGGGEDGYGLIDNVLQGLRTVPAQKCPRTHIVCGPEMSDARRRAVHDAARLLPHVSVQDFSDDMMSLMGAADVVVAMGGYNTVCELLTLRKRALLVPRVKPGVEQFIRAERMAQLGLLRMLHPQDLSPRTLMAGIQAELDALEGPVAPPYLRRMDGLEHVSKVLLEAVGLTPVRVAPTGRVLATAPLQVSAQASNQPLATPMLA